MRDDFKPATKELIAKRAGWLCSNPDCQCATVGAAEGHDSFINVGVAAHITAASPDGPRYDPALTGEKRRHHSNGIWLCQKDGKAVDSDAQRFPVELLRNWKHDAEKRSFQAIVAPGALRDQQVAEATIDAAVQALIHRLGLPAGDNIDTVAPRLVAAATADIAAFKHMAGWPRHAVALNLRMTDGGNERAFHVSGLAAALDTFKELTIIAPPGTGKTTTLIQVADAVTQTGRSASLFVPLGEWASQEGSLLQSVLQRAAFQGMREQHFMLLAHHERLVLLLDGWNELDRKARLRASSEIKRLRRDFPALGIVVSTRRQALDAPISGPVVQIDILSEAQQLEIARALGGARGEALLDRAVRTPGVRSLVSIPLYLTALLLQAPGGAMPTTKEAVLRLFVAEHERGYDRAEALRAALSGHHAEVLTALAVEATRTANTAISDNRARVVVKQVEDRLVAAGQITAAPPAAVIDLFVDQHTLVRAGGVPAAVSFQHQQFQEWYASFEVEEAMRKAAVGDADALHRLRVDILDQPAWEESVLFACERASRDDRAGLVAVAEAIATALSIDPILAAEMIYRAGEDVWTRLRDNVLAFIGRWHAPGVADRAARFMVATGRPEFVEQIWPLVANPDSEVHLTAMRAARRFRPSVLGPNAGLRLAGLPNETRRSVLAELVMRGGPGGIELATAVAREDPSAEVQFAVVEALFFRRADQTAVDLLGVASPQVWSMLAGKGYAGEIADPAARARVERERERFEREASPLARIGWVLASANPSEADKEQITAAVEAADFPARDQNASWQVQRAWERYPEHVARGLLLRLEAERDLPYRASEMLAATAPVNAGRIAAMATNLDSPAPLAQVAASVVGPRTAGSLIDALLVLADEITAAGGRYDQAATERYRILKDRIFVTRETSFAPALLSRGQTDVPHHIGLLADLLAGHGTHEKRRAPFVVEGQVRRDLIALVHRWAETLLSSPHSKRHQLAEVGRAIGRLAEAELADDLHRLLAADLERWQELRARRSAALAQMSMEEQSDAAHVWTRQYREAFAAMGGDPVIGIMRGYLEDPDFGFDAGWVLKEIWDRQQNTPAPSPLKAWPDFATVTARRQERCGEAEPAAAAPPAAMIFAAIERMAVPGSSEKHQHVAIALGRIGLSLPHGDQRAAIDALLALPQPLRRKRELLAALVLDGEVISADLPLQAIREWLADAQQNTWMHREGLWEVEGWLELLPFSDRPAATIEGVELVVDALAYPQRLERVVSALADAPGEDAERVLRDLMERHPQLVSQHEWVGAIIKRGTRSAAIMLMDWARNERADARADLGDPYWMARELVGLIQRHPDLRAEVMRRYEAAGLGRAQAMFEHVLAELGDADAVLALVRAYAASGRAFDGLLQNAIREAALSKEPTADWVGAFELHPVPLPELRKTLFAMTQDESPATAALGKACLEAIDDLRDEYGPSEFEPRHPDVESDQPWPPAAG